MSKHSKKGTRAKWRKGLGHVVFGDSKFKRKTSAGKEVKNVSTCQVQMSKLRLHWRAPYRCHSTNGVWSSFDIFLCHLSDGFRFNWPIKMQEIWEAQLSNFTFAFWQSSSRHPQFLQFDFSFKIYFSQPFFIFCIVKMTMSRYIFLQRWNLSYISW